MSLYELYMKVEVSVKPLNAGGVFEKKGSVISGAAADIINVTGRRLPVI